MCPLNMLLLFVWFAMRTAWSLQLASWHPLW
jgi:hypothetical protein